MRLRPATHDFETYSEAGHVWTAALNKWQPLPGARLKGLPTVGAAAYAEHPSTEVLTFSYRLPGHPIKRWRPGQPNPQDLFDYLASGGLLEAHNVMFERLIWDRVCVPKYGWQSLEPYCYQLRCSMAKARVNGFPGKLGELGKVLNLVHMKDADGKRLLDKFSVPRNPTKANPWLRTRPEDDPADFERLCGYCDGDVESEEEASEKMPDLSDDELLMWQIDQEINWRGIGVDVPGVHACIAILEAGLVRYGEEFRTLTGGLNPTQVQATVGWLHAHGVHLDSLDEEHVTYALALPNLPEHCRRVLEIRALVGSASVKKLYAMRHQVTHDGRLVNLLMHHGARTGRPTGEGPQPLNMPKAGPKLKWCEPCGQPFKTSPTLCPWCGAPAPDAVREWSAEAVPAVLQVIHSGSLDTVEWFFGDALLTLSGCLRGLFIAAPGHDLIASDFSSIEAVDIAMIAGEQWRMEAFEQNRPIYLLSASKITGVPVETYEDYHRQHKAHHPDRQKIGKVAELAGGFGGWIGAWRNFGFDGTDEEAKAQILAWRRASPTIPELWGGQARRGGWGGPEYYGLEGIVVQAIKNPGYAFAYRGVSAFMRGDALLIRLLSGRELTYNSPRLGPPPREWSQPWEHSISYMSWNTNPKYGPLGWVPKTTYGAQIAENVVQAVAHDQLRAGIKRLRAAGYPTVLHVYDEIVVEVPEGTGSVEEVERLMNMRDEWDASWPVRASGGWRGKRYRK